MSANSSKLVSALLLAGAACIILAMPGSESGAASQREGSMGKPEPVLVELFTSEGCSSCPPADALLMKLDREQPVPGALLVVLSEHVDYWNYIGWTDPFSSSFFSERQQRYAQRLATRGPYTPQMVVDGAHEFIGSDAADAQRAIRQSLARTKLNLNIPSYSIDFASVLALVESAPLPAGKGAVGADLLVTLAQNSAASSVTRGENTGRYLPHVAVAKEFTTAARLKPGEKFSGEVELKFGPGFKPEDWRIVAFLQESGQGRVLGAATTQLAAAR